MSKAAVLPLSPSEARCKSEAEHYLAETHKILRRLAAERERRRKRLGKPRDIVAEIKAILAP